jgi:hypothetical protein
MGSFRSPKKAVILLPATDWHCTYKLNKTATPQEKVHCCFWYDATKPVMIVQRQYQTRLETDAPSKNLIMEWYQMLTEECCLCKKGGPRLPQSSDENVK